MLSSTCVAPETGSSRIKLVVVTTKVWPSIPKATPSGGKPRAKVCRVLPADRLMTVSALLEAFGAVKLPKCATTRNWPSGERASEPGCGATLMDAPTVLSASDMTSIVFAVKFAIYRTPRPSSSAMSDACPPMGTTLPKVPAHAAVASAMAAMARTAHTRTNSTFISFFSRMMV